MTHAELSKNAFQKLRSRLFGLAYRMLGSRAEAEDIVQETYVRWHEARHDTINSPDAWLVTTTIRLAIDRLRRLKTEREAYVGPWLPEPIVTPAPPPDQVALTFAVVVINGWNRLAVSFRAPAGSYQPGALAV